MNKHLFTLFFATLQIAAIGCGSSSQSKGDTNGVKDAEALTAATFKTKILDATNSVALVDFWATWCGPCQMIAPAVESVAEKYKGKALVGKVDVDQENALAQKYEIRSLPCLIVFKNGKPVGRVEGLVDENEISKMIEKHL